MKDSFFSFLLPVPFFWFSSYYDTVFQFTYSSHVFTLILEADSLSLSFSFFSCSEFGSPPTFRINLLLLLQILLQAIIIHAALYSRMKYLSCIYTIIFCAMLYTQPRLQKRKSFFLENCQNCPFGDGSCESTRPGSVWKPSCSSNLFSGVHILIS